LILNLNNALAFLGKSHYIEIKIQGACMKQKSRILFVASWLVIRLRWSLTRLWLTASDPAWQRLWSQPGIVLFARRHSRFPIDRWIFDRERSAYLYSAQSDEPLRLRLLPDISCN
jgi:hypothetical protein